MGDAPREQPEEEPIYGRSELLDRCIDRWLSLRPAVPRVSEEGVERTKEFYATEYGRELTDGEAREALQLGLHLSMLLFRGRLEGEREEFWKWKGASGSPPAN